METVKVSTKVGRKRAPNGVDKREITVRLMPEERRKLEQNAASELLTEGAMLREIFLLGLPVWEATHTNA